MNEANNQLNASEKELGLFSLSKEIDTPLPPRFGFIGRGEFMIQLEESLNQNGLILLEGPEGAGKTETVMNLARRQLEGGQSVKVIIYFDLQDGVSWERIHDRLIHVLAPQLNSYTQGHWEEMNETTQKESLKDFLKSFPVLLVLDHLGPSPCPELSPGAALMDYLQGFLGGATRVILTAEKHPENWFPQTPRHLLPGLALLDAQSLAQQIFQAAGFSSRKINSLSPYQDLLTRLEGNPLALQVMLPDLLHKAPAEILRQFDTFSTSVSHSSLLKRTLCYRFGTMDPTLRQRLAILGLFRGCISARILTAMASLPDAPRLIAALDREEWLRLLETFAEMGLARRVGEGSFLMHSAIQTHMGQLFESELLSEKAWLQKSYCQVCGRAGNQLFKILQANPQFGQSLLMLEEKNLLAAFQLALRNQDFPSLREVLCGLRAALTLQGRWTEWDGIVTQLESLLTSPDGQPNSLDELLWFRLLGHRAEICEHRRNLDQLRQIHRQLRRQHFQECESDEHLLDDLGAIAKTRGQYEEATRFYIKSLALRERKNDDAGQGFVLQKLGDLSLLQKKYRDAEKWFSKSMEIWKRLAHPGHQASIYGCLGTIAQERGELDVAKTHYSNSLSLLESFQDVAGQAQSIHQLGNIALLQGEFESAEIHYRRSLQLFEQGNDHHGRALNLQQLAHIARARGQNAEADVLCGQAEHLLRLV